MKSFANDVYGVCVDDGYPGYAKGVYFCAKLPVIVVRPRLTDLNGLKVRKRMRTLLLDDGYYVGKGSWFDR